MLNIIFSFAVVFKNVANLSRIWVEGGSLVVQDFKAFYWSFYTYVVEGLLIEWVFRMRTFD